MSRIVGIGASAGGFESLERLFSAMSADTGMAFVVIHVSDELIAPHSEMPVIVIEDGLEIEPNHIYLVPPRTEMIIRGRRLMPTDKPSGLPIDSFFRSLAQDVGPDAVAVVLSGTGSDGSRGVVDIKRAGGLVMIETPATAKFDSMPLSAQATGVVDHIASPRDVALLLRRGQTELSLRATIADLESSNEAMQATNDELVASNKELQTTNQEQAKIRALLDATAEAACRQEHFLAMLSHELRNPLSAVIAATTLLSRDPDRALFDHCRTVIERQSRHMSRLLDDLLDVSRITRGKFELRSADLDLRTAIEAAVETTTPLFDQRGVTLDVSLPREPVPMSGDGARLQQVVANLLSNAANYSTKGERVELRLVATGDQALLRVVDRGFGIEREMLTRIFELFVQAEQRIDRPRGGLGVGLSLAKSIVELHGGSIEARSGGPNLGSEFVVRLPLVRASTVLERPRTSTRGPRRRIVLVEDQKDSRVMLRMLLEALDHTVLDASDGAEAIALIERERPDAALIDIGLPTMNGYEVAQRIRERKDLQHILLVALTGYGAPSDLSAARSAGFDAHLIKPADVSRIEELLAVANSEDLD